MNTIKKISILFLTAVFLASGMGITIGSMICLESGKGKVSFSIMEDCCAKQKPEDCCDDSQKAGGNSVYSFEKGECCAISNLSLKLNEFNFGKKVQFEQPVVDVPFYSLNTNYFNFTVAQPLSFQFTDLPPPYHGRTLLNHISTLRI